MRTHLLGALILAPLIALAAPASAVTLPYSGEVTADTFVGIVASEHPELQGVTVASKALPFSQIQRNPDGTIRSELDGTLTQTVVRENATGTLDFYYTVAFTNTAHPILVMGTGGFEAGPTVDADYLRDTGSNPLAPPVFLQYEPASGQWVASLNMPPAQGNATPYVFPTILVRTTATQFADTGTTRVTGGFGALPPPYPPVEITDLSTYAPRVGSAPVPEPGVALLLGAGLSALTLRLRLGQR